MVTARNEPASIGRGRDLIRPALEARHPGDRPFSSRETSLARLPRVLYRFRLALLSFLHLPLPHSIGLSN